MNKIPECLKKLCGVYVIRNSVDHRVYIGSSANIDERLRIHTTHLVNNKHHSRYLQRFVNKYGIGTIRFEVLEFCASENLIAVEQRFIEMFDCANYRKGFNMSKQAHSCKGVKHTKATRNKMAENMRNRPVTDKMRAAFIAANKARVYDSEVMRQRATGRKPSAETTAKRTASLRATYAAKTPEQKATQLSNLKRKNNDSSSQGLSK